MDHVTAMQYAHSEEIECLVLDTLTEYYSRKSVAQLVKELIAEQSIEAQVNTYNNIIITGA